MCSILFKFFLYVLNTNENCCELKLLLTVCHALTRSKRVSAALTKVSTPFKICSKNSVGVDYDLSGFKRNVMRLNFEKKGPVFFIAKKKDARKMSQLVLVKIHSIAYHSL